MPGLVHVSGYQQRRDGHLVDVVDHERGVPAGGGKKPWHGMPHEKYRERIAYAERSADKANDGYGEINPSGALGRYQLTLIALKDIGWKDADGAWTDLARKQRVDSDSAFLANPAAQENAMTAYTDRNDFQLDKNGSNAHIGETYPDHERNLVEITETGLAAAAHREGAEATRRTLQKLKEKAAGHRRTFSKEEKRVIKRLRDFSDVPYANS